MLSESTPPPFKNSAALPRDKKHPQKPHPGSKPIRIFAKNLSNSTKLKFDKSLVKLWVKFGKNLVPVNQRVEKSRF